MPSSLFIDCAVAHDFWSDFSFSSSRTEVIIMTVSLVFTPAEWQPAQSAARQQRANNGVLKQTYQLGTEHPLKVVGLLWRGVYSNTILEFKDVALKLFWELLANIQRCGVHLATSDNKNICPILQWHVKQSETHTGKNVLINYLFDESMNRSLKCQISEKCPSQLSKTQRDVINVLLLFDHSKTLKIFCLFSHITKGKSVFLKRYVFGCRSFFCW